MINNINCKIIWLSYLAGILCLNSEVFAAGEDFYKDKQRGWYWYEVLPLPEKESENKDKKQQKTTITNSSSPTEKIKAYKGELENRLAKAWINPTPQNVKSYQEMQKDMLNRSQNFSEVWEKNVITNASLDQSLISPINQGAIHVKNDIERQRKSQVIKSLSKHYGLFFFFSSACAYCHKFAPIVRSFSETYGWEVLAISIDGGQIAGFKNIPDNGLARQWNVQALPSLYAVNPETEHVIQVAHGMSSIDEMESRIMALLENK